MRSTYRRPPPPVSGAVSLTVSVKLAGVLDWPSSLRPMHWNWGAPVTAGVSVTTPSPFWMSEIDGPLDCWMTKVVAGVSPVLVHVSVTAWSMVAGFTLAVSDTATALGPVTTVVHSDMTWNMPSLAVRLSTTLPDCRAVNVVVADEAFANVPPLVGDTVQRYVGIAPGSISFAAILPDSPTANSAGHVG